MTTRYLGNMPIHFPNNQVLITGASGWLGHGLLRVLTQGLPEVEALRTPPDVRIRALVEPTQDIRTLQAEYPQIEFIAGDLRRPDDCRRFCEGAAGATVLHLVGLIHPRRIRELYDINVECTRNLHTAAIEAGIKRIVSMSSNSPAGCNPNREHRFTEQSPYNPYMHYGRAKMQMEQLIQSIHATGNIETVVIRATWFYGPFHPPRQSLFFRMVRDGQAPIIGSGENLRSMSCVYNVCHALILAATTDKANGELYWIADERAYTMNEIVDTVERLLETEFGQTCRHKRLRLPNLACEVARFIDGCLQSVGLYHQKIHVLSEMNKHIACSIEKARQELGYHPAFGLEEGIRRSLQQMHDNGEFNDGAAHSQ
jgi:nucleoside-diphosphate-sugar epimerase